MPRNIAKHPLLVAACGWIVVCAFIWGASQYSARHARDATAFFEHALADTGAVTVERYGIPYRIIGGIAYRQSNLTAPLTSPLPVLELTYMKVAAERSPILAIPGENLTNIRAVTEKLKQTQGELAALQTTQPAAHAIERLYPINFLSSLAAAEDARRSFVTSGADTDASRYDDTLRNTLNAYESDLAKFRKSFTDTVPDVSAMYAASDVIVSKQAIESALDQLGNAFLATRARVLSRTACVHGVIHDCDITDLSFPHLTPPQTVKIDTASFSTAAQIQRLLASSFKDPDILKAPLVALSDSSCAAGIPGTPIFTMYTSSVGGEALPTPLLLGDIRFLRTDSYPLPFLQYFASHGVTYMWYSPFTHYKCFHLQSDTSKILATTAVRSLVEESPLSKYAKDAGGAIALRALEHTITDGEVLQESDAVRYLSLALDLGGALPDGIKTHVIALALQFKYHTGGLEDTVRKIALSEHVNKVLFLAGVPTDLSAPRLFFSDSGFIPLFLGDNGSFIDTAHGLMPPNTLAASEEPYVYYSAMPRAVSQSPALEHDIAFFNNLYATLKP